MPGTILLFGRMIRFSHTIFALPFALAAAALAAERAGWPWQKLPWIVLALVAARTSAMGFNRIADRHIDAKNPRTAQRELPSGAVSLGWAWGLTLASGAAFLVAAAMLGRACGLLGPPVLLFICGYSYAKRITWLSHLWLGAAVALAPAGAWFAIAGEASWPAVLMLTAVGAWVAGFDVLYSLQDLEFDRASGLHSIPARFGVRGALALSAILHVATVAGLVALGAGLGLGSAYWVGVLAIGAILAYEHAIVRPGDLSRIDRAFFDLNGYVSVVFFVCTAIDVALR